MSSCVVGDDRPARAELRPDDVEILAGRFLVAAVEEDDVDGARDLREFDQRVAEVIDDHVGHAGAAEMLAGGFEFLLRDVDGVQNTAGALQGGGPEEATESVAGADFDDQLCVACQGDLVKHFAFDAGDLPGVIAGLAQRIHFINQGGEFFV